MLFLDNKMQHRIPGAAFRFYINGICFLLSKTGNIVLDTHCLQSKQ